MTTNVCIIGGGVSGVGAWWCLSQPNQPGYEWNVTLLHNAASLGGHAWTVPVPFKGQTVNVDTGVQFYAPLLYRNIDAILARQEFSKVLTQPYDGLKVGCGFPRAAGAMQNWGNMPDYGATDTTKAPGSPFALYSPAMWADAVTFQDAVDASVLGGLSQTLDPYFAANAAKYQDLATFQNMFLASYLSIINGYGATLTDQVTFGDLLPLFGSLGSGSPWPGLARFTEPSQGFTRFVDGASSFVEAMAASAAQNKPGATVTYNADVTAVYPEDQAAVVEWTDGTGSHSQSFDKVIITTDMQATSSMLAAKGTAWSSLYEKYICPLATQLLPGYCMVHTDSSVLSPDLAEGEETVQFTAYYAGDDTQPGDYNLFLTYTTYLQGNIHSECDADGLYLTMYGYVPEGVPQPVRPSNPCNAGPITQYPSKIPAQDTVLFQEYWTHGMWLPQFMLAEKRAMHMAQGPGNINYQGQSPYPIYFAGNNLTADSLEHAFLSGAIIADYAFAAPLPVIDNIPAALMYELFKEEFMFPTGTSTGADTPDVSARQAEILLHALTSPT
jgi:hypothetical protein